VRRTQLAGGSSETEGADGAGQPPVPSPPPAPAVVEPPIGECIAFRRTAGCRSDGPREPWGDRGCSDTVVGGVSGYCECTGGRMAAESSCTHVGFSCVVACGELLEIPLHVTDGREDRLVAPPWHDYQSSGLNAICHIHSFCNTDADTGEGGDNGIVKMQNRREISVSADYDQSLSSPVLMTRSSYLGRGRTPRRRCSGISAAWACQDGWCWRAARTFARQLPPWWSGRCRSGRLMAALASGRRGAAIRAAGASHSTCAARFHLGRSPF
jgi:hypothetical protein